jgi:hypothetical protein
MSRFYNYLIEDKGAILLSENISKNQVIELVKSILSMNSHLTEVIEEIRNKQWKTYIENYAKTSVIIADAIMKEPLK